MTGTVVGDLQVVFPLRHEEMSAGYPVEGKMVADVRVKGDAQSGTFYLTIDGTVVDGIFQAHITGVASGDAGGRYPISGAMRGTISQTQGFGTWQLSITGGRGSGTGEWTLQRGETVKAGAS